MTTFLRNIDLRGHRQDEVGRLHFAENAMGHQVVRLFPRAWDDMFEDGTIDNFVLPYNTYWPTIWVDHVFNDLGSSEPVGFIHYRTDMDNAWWVCSSYVLPAFRRCGIYAAMFDELKARAADKGVLRIGGGTSNANVGMQAAYKATGRQPASQIWYYDLQG